MAGRLHGIFVSVRSFTLWLPPFTRLYLHAYATIELTQKHSNPPTSHTRHRRWRSDRNSAATRLHKHK